MNLLHEKSLGEDDASRLSLVKEIENTNPGHEWTMRRSEQAGAVVKTYMYGGASIFKRVELPGMVEIVDARVCQ